MVGIRIRLGHTTMHQESKLERHIGNKQQPNSVDRSNGNISTVIQRQYWNITKHVGLEFRFGTSVGPKRNEMKRNETKVVPFVSVALDCWDTCFDWPLLLFLRLCYLGPSERAIGCTRTYFLY
jgi:hypothetical protein